jgi:hypothetical protein
VCLQCTHLVPHAGGLQHLHGRLLEGHVGTAVEVGAAGPDGIDELLGADDPRDAPAGEAEALG